MFTNRSSSAPAAPSPAAVAGVGAAVGAAVGVSAATAVPLLRSHSHEASSPEPAAARISNVAFGEDSPNVSALDSAITELTQLETAARQLEAERVRLLAQVDGIVRSECARIGEAGPHEASLAYRAVRAEVAAAIGLAEQTSERHLAQAALLHSEYPGTVATMAAGTISSRHAQVLTDEGSIISAHATDPGSETDELIAARRQAYETRVLEVAASTTPGRLRPLARQIAEEYALVSLDDRYEKARIERRVWLEERSDGMAALTAHLPAHQATAIYSRLTRMARHIEKLESQHLATLRSAAEATAEPSDQETAFRRRTRDEIRADLLSDLLTQAVDGELSSSNIAEQAPGTSPDLQFASDAPTAGKSASEKHEPLGQIRGIVQLLVSAETLLDGITGSTSSRNGSSSNSNAPPGNTGPPWLEGYGPIPVAMAREIAGQTEAWERITVRPESGEILSVNRYRPSEAIKRYILARDQHCRFPGCRIPAHRCDIDHTIDAALGGPTSTANLGAICRGHHTLKHHTGWNVTQDDSGTYEWTSPTGRVYREHAPSKVRFSRTDNTGTSTSTGTGTDASADASAGASTSRTARLNRIARLTGTATDTIGIETLTDDTAPQPF